MTRTRECTCAQCRGDGPPDSYWGQPEMDDDAAEDLDDRTEERDDTDGEDA